MVALVGLPALHRSYRSSGGADRQRLQWLGCGVAVTAELTLVIGALHALVDWPEHAMVVAGAATLVIPASLAAGASSRLVTRVDRLLVHTVSLAGLTTVVLGVYLVIVLGLGQVPGQAERHLLVVLSMAAAAVATVLYPAARARFADLANRLVYGDRTAPDEEEDRVLTELARQVGLALHNVQLDSALQASLDEVRRQAEELRASRARIVATADAERRKIERNLHDGAQQHLVALAVNLRLTKDVLADDPAAAAEMLEMLAGSVKDTIQELRDLAHGIYPPLLVDSGLSEALRAAANRSPLDVRVDVEGVGRHHAEVEAAVYFCCLEALQNAAKHAPDATVQLRVEEGGGTLRFEVSDDGPGFDPGVVAGGHGFVNMSDRLGAIGGSVRWDSTPGQGTTVRGRVPLT
ncbi:MAG: histidine kinase [Actinomycetota bacterium]|nr:histidine kinase [Actinomycetota bacterium]